MRRLTRLLVVVPVVLLAVACGDDDDGGSTPSGSLKPADAQSPAAGVCPGPTATEPETIQLQPGISAPRCVRILTTNYLRLVNGYDHPVEFELGVFTGSLQSGGDAISDRSVGEFLAPGVHVMQFSGYGDGSDEVWVVTEEMAERFELTIHRSDGTEEVLHLLSQPIVCGQLQGNVIELCGEQIVGGQIIAVDFIPVNQGLGETYDVNAR